MKAFFPIAVVLSLSGCHLEKHPSQFNLLMQFQSAVNQTEGMELEQRNTITNWIADGTRILIVNPKKWEGQARLEWPKVRSMCGPYDSLSEWVSKIDKELQ